MIKPLLLAASLIVYAFPAHTTELPEKVSLGEILDLVLKRSPALSAERTRIDGARAGIDTAGAFPNPEISYTRLRGEREMMVEQPLPIFGQIGLRKDTARLELEATVADIEAAAAEIIYEAASAFTTLLVAQERRRIWANADSTIATAMRIVEGQVEAGARSRYDLARIRLERTQLAMELEQAAGEVSGSSAALAAIAGIPTWQPEAVGSLKPSSQVLAFETLWPRAQDRLANLKAASAEEAAAIKRIDLARREAWPMPSVGVGRLREPDGSRAVYGMAVEIPLFDRQHGPIRRAEAEAAEAHLRRTTNILNAESELRQATERFSRRLKLMEDFEREGLSQLADLQRMAEDAYALGQSGILELIDAIQAVADKRLAHLDLVESALQAEIDVRSAAGELSPLSTSPDQVP